MKGSGERFIVITSINDPTDAVRSYARIAGWQLIVVGDKKTRSNWHCEGATYLSPEKQLELGYRICDGLPWNHYTRKMVGYLYAIEHGARVIVDTDDDNKPLATWGFPAFDGNYDEIRTKGFINCYKEFTDQPVWPRGLPLASVTKESIFERGRAAFNKVGIWQFLAAGDPDVDAIYRLTSGRTVTFRDAAPFVLAADVWSPFNSQNTAFREEAFALLFLPATVTFRFTDILRGWVAQPGLWKINMRLGFGPATVYQDRNPHDFMEDFRSEMPMYLFPDRCFEDLTEAARSAEGLLSYLQNAYEALARAGIVNLAELSLLTAWLADLRDVKG
jgi:hypothetical protein